MSQAKSEEIENEEERRRFNRVESTSRARGGADNYVFRRITRIDKMKHLQALLLALVEGKRLI